MENYNSQIKNYLLPFSVKILVAIILHISINSFSNQPSSVLSPFDKSLSNVSQTFDSFPDFNECVKKLIKSFFDEAEFASI